MTKKKQKNLYLVGDKWVERDDWPQELDPAIHGECRMGHCRHGVYGVKKVVKEEEG